MTKTQLTLIEDLIDAKITATTEKIFGGTAWPSQVHIGDQKLPTNKRKRAVEKAIKTRKSLQDLCTDK